MTKKQVMLFIVCLLLPVCASAQMDEYMLKAVYLERFTRFVEWPDSTSPETFEIAVIGENPFGSVLEEIYATRRIKERKVVVRQISSPSDISGCHLSFISGSEKERLADILAVADREPILTIGDTDGFARQGVLINLFSDAERIRYEINDAAVRKSELAFSYRLFTLATIVNRQERTR